MKRFACLSTLLLCTLAIQAGEVQKNMKSRWLGAWVVTTIETYSDCGGMYTNNRINGNLVKSRGAHGFDDGELAKLDRVDAKRSRVDVSLSLAEPVLVPYQDGPFTLYREQHCRVELEIEIPRESIKKKDTETVEQALMLVLERYANEREARSSASYGGRERADYPADYESTLHEHSVWVAVTTNEQVQSQLDLAMGETNRLTERVTSDPDYLEGFVHGVETARESDLRDCSSLLAVDLDRKPRKSQNSTPEQVRSRRGYEDGKNLIFGLEMIRRLPDCFVEIPDTTGDAEDS